MADNQFLTWFDLFPIEIIFQIFEYLANNDIIHTFFHFDQRLNCLLSQEQQYLKHLELPTKDFNCWQNILPIIGFQTQSLSITSNDFFFSLDSFPNLTSIQISSSFPYDSNHLTTIIESKQFHQLQSFKIQSNTFIQKSPCTYYEQSEKILFAKIFHEKNSLQSFEYSPKTSFVSLQRLLNLTTNFNLQFLTLKYISLNLVLAIIQYAPNLKYLNVITDHLNPGGNTMRNLNLSNIQLKTFYLTLYSSREISYSHYDFDQVTTVIRQLSSSLICLSIDVSNAECDSLDGTPFDGIRLQQQLLQAMKELKEFHLYVKFDRNLHDVNQLLSTFSNEFWLDRHWYVGIHNNYLYTFPFVFEKFHDFIPFDHIQSTNSRFWSKVKSIEFSRSTIFNINFLKQLQIKMPKLISIKINPDYLSSIGDITENEVLNSVTTVHFTNGSLDNVKKSFFDILPNLKHLILSDTEFPLSKNEVAAILTEKIQKLDIITNSNVEQLIKMSHVFFSNVQHIQLTICYQYQKHDLYANEIKKILTSFKNLQQLAVNMYGRGNWPEMEMSKLLAYLNDINKFYQIRQYHEYVCFSKKN